MMKLQPGQSLSDVKIYNLFPISLPEAGGASWASIPMNAEWDALAQISPATFDEVRADGLAALDLICMAEQVPVRTPRDWTDGLSGGCAGPRGTTHLHRAGLVLSQRRKDP